MIHSERHGAWHLNDYVHPLFHDGGVICMNSESGTRSVLPRRQGRVLLTACDLMDSIDLTWPEFTQEEPRYARFLHELQAEDLIAAGTSAAKPDLLQAIPHEGIEALPNGAVAMGGLLTEPHPPETELEHMAEQNLGHVQQLIASQCFGVLKAQIRAARGTTARPSTIKEGREIAQAVRQVSDWSPGKFACYEHSLTTVYIGALQGLHLDLQFGASLDPISIHAWPKAEGQPVVLPGDPLVQGHYYPIFKI